MRRTFVIVHGTGSTFEPTALRGTNAATALRIVFDHFFMRSDGSFTDAHRACARVLYGQPLGVADLPTSQWPRLARGSWAVPSATSPIDTEIMAAYSGLMFLEALFLGKLAAYVWNAVPPASPKLC